MSDQRVMAPRRRGRTAFLSIVAAGTVLAALPLVWAGAPQEQAQKRGTVYAPTVHSFPDDIPDITSYGEGLPLQVQTANGPLWIDQITPCPDGDPYPGCLVCHCEIENAFENMGGWALDCTFCHGGDPDATDKETAHVHSNGQVKYNKTVPPRYDDLEYQRFVNPSNLRVVGDTCGVCHHTKASDIPKSMMATAAGHYSGGLFQNGVVDTKTPIYGTFAVTDDDGYVPVEDGAVESLLDLLVFSGGDPSQIATHFAAVPSQGCARCHLWSRGKGYRGAESADGVYRADGCAACHMPYGNDGLSHSLDFDIDHTEPGHPINHVITKAVSTEQCLHCHHRGARIGLSFTGRAQMPPRLPSGPGVPGTTDEKFNGNYHYTDAETNPQDVHREAGLHCIDCHVSAEFMGDGNIFGHMDQATKIECRMCHGLPGEFPTLSDNDGLLLRNVKTEERRRSTGTTERENVVLRSKVTGKKHKVPLLMEVATSSYNPYAACAMNGNHLKPEGGLECYSCHASWVPNCFGCHFERDERKKGVNLITREVEVGKISTNNKIFEALRHFAIGPNSEGRTAPYIVGCQPIADVTAADGTKILDFVMPVTANGLSGLAMNPVNPHTVRGVGEVRSCAECHRSPPSLGFGSGNYSIARDRAYASGTSGVALYDRDSDPEQPVPEGLLPGAGAAKAVASYANVIEGTADFLYVARGESGLDIYDLRGGDPIEPVFTIVGIDAIDVSRAAQFLYVVDRGVGVRVYLNKDPAIAMLVATVPAPTALRAVPWGIHLFVAAGSEGLLVVNIADNTAPFVDGSVTDVHAADVQLYAHYQGGSDFAVRAYVADPAYGVRIVDLLPDFHAPQLVDSIPLMGALGLDSYTAYVTASDGVPSREHDYLYVAAGPAGLHVFDITDPDGLVPVAAVTDLGGIVADVDVTSQLSPPGVEDYAIIANEILGLQVVKVSDPQQPVSLGTVPGSLPAERVFVEVQQLDRFLDEQGNPLKENSHPFTGAYSREDIVRILSTSIDCGASPSADFDGDGVVGTADLLALLDEWGPCPPPPAECQCDVNGDGRVDMLDLLALLVEWG